MRVHELAAELGVSSKDVLQAAAVCKLFLKSASTVMRDDDVDRLRAHFGWPKPAVRPPLRPLGPPPARRPTRSPWPAAPGDAQGWAPISPPPRSPRYGQKLGSLAQFFFDRDIFPSRTTRDLGGPTVAEAERANANAVSWVSEMFTDAEARMWLKHHPHIPASVAAAFRRVGISPEQAALRPWYGKLNPERRSLVERVCMNEISVEQARAELDALAG